MCESNKERKMQSRLVIFSFILVFVLWVASYFLMTYFFGSKNMDVGKAGDLFGAINALFSGLAFACIIWSIFLQRQDLLATLEEMKQTREAQQESAKALAEQIEIDRIKIRTDALKTLIDAPLQIFKDNLFTGHKDKMKPFCEDVPRKISALARIEEKMHDIIIYKEINRLKEFKTLTKEKQEYLNKLNEKIKSIEEKGKTEIEELLNNW